jgi:hypothetical protein
MKERIAALLGTWKSDPSDTAASLDYGKVTLEFGADGTLLYISHGSDKDDVIRLTYTVEPDFIVTDQPSQPRVERTRYRFTDDGKLILSFAGQESSYVRAM